MKSSQLIKYYWRKHSPIFIWQISGNSPKQPFNRPLDPWKGDKQTGEKVFRTHPYKISNNYWHSFEWLRDLREISDKQARVRSRDLCLEWAKQNSEWDPISWGTEIMGKRLSNILLCYGAFADTAEINFQEALIKQFASQVRCLELDLQNLPPNQNRINTLLGIIAGRVCLTPLISEIESIVNIIYDDVNKLLNSNGMHISRQPEFHFQLLKIIIEVRALILSSPNSLNKINPIIKKMTECAKLFCHGDGSIGKFNGGSILAKENINQIIKKAEVPYKISNSITEDGYARLNSKQSTILFDCGSPQKNWSDWHAGTLSFELSYGKQLIVVNSGSLKNDTNWKIALRGTAAHSTLSIDRKNSSNLKTNENNQRIANIIENNFEKTDAGFEADATHDGYFLSHGTFHKRKIFLDKSGDTVLGKDKLIYSGAPGAIPIEGKIRFHLSPDIKAGKVFSGDILLKPKSGLGWTFKSKSNNISIEDSIYVKDLKIIKCQQIIIRLTLTSLRSRGTILSEWGFFKNNK